MKLTARSLRLFFFISVAVTLYIKLSGLLREFNFDVARLLTKMAKHPAAWIDWGWLTVTAVVLFIIWLKNKDEEDSPTNWQWWLLTATALLIGIPSALLLFEYWQQRNREKAGVSEPARAESY